MTVQVCGGGGVSLYTWMQVQAPQTRACMKSRSPSFLIRTAFPALELVLCLPSCASRVGRDPAPASPHPQGPDRVCRMLGHTAEPQRLRFLHRGRGGQPFCLGLVPGWPPAQDSMSIWGRVRMPVAVCPGRVTPPEAHWDQPLSRDSLSAPPLTQTCLFSPQNTRSAQRALGLCRHAGRGS